LGVLKGVVCPWAVVFKKGLRETARTPEPYIGKKELLKLGDVQKHIKELELMQEKNFMLDLFFHSIYIKDINPASKHTKSLRIPMTEKDALRSFIMITQGPMEEYQFLMALAHEIDALRISTTSRLPRKGYSPPTKNQLTKSALNNMKDWYRYGYETRIPLKWKDLARWIPSGRVAKLWCVALRRYHLLECQ
jgi:hypothetical protein